MSIRTNDCPLPPRATAVRTRLRSAFTLVELLVVIGIIALLISILLPSLSRAREAGNAVKCLSNLRQLGMAMTMYANENKYYYPAAAACWPAHKVRQEDWIWWQEIALPPNRPAVDPGGSQVAKFLGGFNAELLRCPSDDVMTHAAPTTFGVGSLSPYRYSYTLNRNMASCDYDAIRPTGATRPLVKSTQVLNPSEKILMVEEDERSLNDGMWDAGAGNPAVAEARDLLAIRHDRAKTTADDPLNQVLTTHPNGERRGNVVFCDGHGEFVSRVRASDKDRIFPWHPFNR